MKFKDFLVTCGLLTEFNAMMSESQERALLYDLWKLLQGEEKEEVTIDSLRVVLQVVLRLIDIKRVIDAPPAVNHLSSDQRSETPNKTDISDIGFLNSKNEFCIRHLEVPKIQAHFKIFYLNRLQHQGKQLEAKKEKQASVENNKNSFKPKIA